jgi:hypothetical protein
MIRLLKQALSTVLRSERRFDEIRLNQGRILAGLNATKASRRLADYEFKVFSQWGEDGIIQHLVQLVGIAEQTFIEFGVEDFSESNCRYLLMQDNWRGFVIDASAANIRRLQGSYYFWQHELTAVAAFITRENVNQLLARSGFGDDLGLLSIDIDGNDYHVLQAINQFRPRILVCEYNAVFGPTRRITVPYEAAFERASKHYSCLYWGASLAALTALAHTKGYALVGTNSVGTNAFYVRNDLLNDSLPVLSAEQAYVPSRLRDSRDPQGRLSYVAGAARLELIRGLPVLNVDSGAIEAL